MCVIKYYYKNKKLMEIMIAVPWKGSHCTAIFVWTWWCPLLLRVLCTLQISLWANSSYCCFISGKYPQAAQLNTTNNTNHHYGVNWRTNVAESTRAIKRVAAGGGWPSRRLAEWQTTSTLHNSNDKLCFGMQRETTLADWPLLSTTEGNGGVAYSEVNKLYYWEALLYIHVQYRFRTH